MSVFHVPCVSATGRARPVPALERLAQHIDAMRTGGVAGQDFERVERELHEHVVAVEREVHWGIENGLHWRLDVTFREDESRIRRGNAPRDIGVIRHVAMNLLKREKTKISYRKKRIRAALNDTFRHKLLMGQ